MAAFQVVEDILPQHKGNCKGRELTGLYQIGMLVQGVD
jgi:hypothetical protein